MILNKENTICFYGHTSGDHAFLSNFYPIRYYTNYFGGYLHSSEQSFMLHKALSFGDQYLYIKILESKDAKEAKALGKQVKNFNDQHWSVLRQACMCLSLQEKFVEPELRKKLIDTGDKYLIEASPYDKIWGVGMDKDHPDIYDTEKWNGLNELGHCLMFVRKIINVEEHKLKRNIINIETQSVLKQVGKEYNEN